MTLDIEKIKAAAMDAKRVGDDVPVLLVPDDAIELITRLEEAERELNLLKPNPLCDVGCMLSCSMEGTARLEAAEKDAARYRWLRDVENQLLEDDPCVSDDCFTTYYDSELDDTIDRLIKRNAAIKESEK